MKVSQLEAPPSQRLLRRVDQHFVDSLTSQLHKDPAAPGVPPLALLCKEEKDKAKFREDLVAQYSYEVIGGLHSVEARKQVLLESPGKDALRSGIIVYLTTATVKDLIIYGIFIQITPCLERPWASFTAACLTRKLYG